MNNDVQHAPHSAEQFANALLASQQLIVALLRAKPTPFSAPVTGAGSFATPRDTTGVLQSIHNPTANPLTVTIGDGSAGAVVFSQQLAGGATTLTYLPFKNGLYVVAGAGAILGGDFAA